MSKPWYHNKYTMRRDIDKIQIQEPPIEELKKRSSCLKRTCSTGCGCVVVFLVIAVLIIKFTAGPNMKELKSVPENFPKNIPVYDKDNIEKIIFTSGKDRGRAMEYIAYGPKLFLSPIFMLLEKKFPVRDKPEDGRMITDENYWESFVRIMKEPVADHRDKVQIEWSNMPAEPQFVYNYYKDELIKAGFAINESSDADDIRQFAFYIKDTEGVLYMTDELEKNGTDFVSLTVNIGIEP